MLKNRVLLFFIIFLAVPALSFANGILIIKDTSPIYFVIGKYHFNNKDFSSAVHYFKKAIEAEPDFAEAYYNLGISLYYSGDKDSALNFLKKAIETKHDYSQAYYSTALIYYERKDFDC